MISDRYLGMAISKPAAMVFRVIDRRGSVCCANPATSSAMLRFRNKHFDYDVSKGKLEMMWKLSR